MQEVHNPTMHESALHLIAVIHAIHAAGSGRIPLLNMLEMFGVAFTESQTCSIRDRGDLSLTAQGSDCGVFENQGSPFSLSTGLVTLACSSVSGQYIVEPGRCYLRFNPAHTMVGTVLLVFTARLKGIYVDQQMINIQMDNPDYDQKINHSTRK